MRESKVISVVEKGLFVKFGLLTLLIVGLVFATPAAQLVKAGGHKICQVTLMKDSGHKICQVTLMKDSGCPTA